MVKVKLLQCKAKNKSENEYMNRSSEGITKYQKVKLTWKYKTLLNKIKIKTTNVYVDNLSTLRCRKAWCLKDKISNEKCY